MAVTLDEDRNVYFDSTTGQVFTRVSTILSDLGLLPYRPGQVPEQRMLEGEFVHIATALFDEGTLDWGSVDPAYEGYVRGWEAFTQECEYQPLTIEQVVYNPLAEYAGTLDRVCTIAKQRGVLDIKTGVPIAATKLQTAAYSECLGGGHLRWVVYLNDKGRYKLVRHENPGDINVFMAAALLHRWKRTAKVA